MKRENRNDLWVAFSTVVSVVVSFTVSLRLISAGDYRVAQFCFQNVPGVVALFMIAFYFSKRHKYYTVDNLGRQSLSDSAPGMVRFLFSAVPSVYACIVGYRIARLVAFKLF